jgi:hypothetical protein
MQIIKKISIILTELKNHSPFTLFGALTGIVCMLVFKNLPQQTSQRIFYIFHPAHVLLSAMVTASIFELHTKKKKFIGMLLVGFIGSIGISTLSDSLIPYIGEILLGMHIHVHEHAGFVERAHIGFIEEWQIIIPTAIAGVLIAYFWPKTKFPHAGHVLLSTWASSFHIIMAMGGHLSLWEAIGSFGFLFAAVLLPCCFSDIVFPLLFIKPALSEVEGSEGNPSHAHHH